MNDKVSSTSKYISEKEVSIMSCEAQWGGAVTPLRGYATGPVPRLPEDSPHGRFATEDSPQRRFATQRVRPTNATENLSVSVAKTFATVPMWKIRHTTVIG